MKNLLLATIAAVLLVGCGQSQQSAPAPETEPVEPVAEVPAQPSPTPVEAKPVKPVAEAAKPTTPPKAVSANKGADPDRGIKPEPQTAKAPDIPIHEAVLFGNIEDVKQHLAVGTDVNAKEEEEGMTPLIVAVGEGHKKIIELLIANGADVNAQSDMGTPLHLAAGFGHNEIAKLLIAKGADVNAKNDVGDTPLDYWAEMNTEGETANLLRKHGGKTGEELKAEGK